MDQYLFFYAGKKRKKKLWCRIDGSKCDSFPKYSLPYCSSLLALANTLGSVTVGKIYLTSSKQP
jgi:hypothetical protein